MTTLVIDMNAIMNSSVALYADAVNINTGKNQNWEGIFDYKNIEKFVEPDYKLIKNIIKLLILNKDKVEFVDNSKDIVDILKDEKSIQLINVDFFNDIDESSTTLDFNEVTNENWVSVLLNKGLVDNYTWVKAINSPVPQFTKDIGLKEPIALSSMHENFVFEADKVIIADSIFVPYKFSSFFEIFKTVVRG